MAYLLGAGVMSAPAALVAAKITMPTEKGEGDNDYDYTVRKQT